MCGITGIFYSGVTTDRSGTPWSTCERAARTPCTTLEAEGLRALTVESSLISGIPVAGIDFTLRPDDIAVAVAARLGSNSDAGAHR